MYKGAKTKLEIPALVALHQPRNATAINQKKFDEIILSKT